MKKNMTIKKQNRRNQVIIINNIRKLKKFKGEYFLKIEK